MFDRESAGNKAVNREGLEGAMKAVWNISHKFTVEMIGISNTFVRTSKSFGWRPMEFWEAVCVLGSIFRTRRNCHYELFIGFILGAY